MPENNSKNVIDQVLFILYLCFFICLVFAFRAFTSISLGLILIAGLIKTRTQQKKFFHSNLNNAVFFSCLAFFLFQAISFFYTKDLYQGWRNIQMKSALLVIPIALCNNDFINEFTREKLLKGYCLVIFIACLFALFTASINYSATNNSAVFFYHRLVSIYSGHAIQFSILVFVALSHLFIFTFIKQHQVFSKAFDAILMIFLSAFIFFLSSKLVIAFFIMFFIYLMFRGWTSKSKSKISVSIWITGSVIFCLLIFSSYNFVSGRFREVIKTDFSFLEKEKYMPRDYFNGLQFRLLQWRFIPQILDQEKAWMAGVSPGDAQARLNEKYISERMYTGTKERGDRGFLGYNAHNEFLESLLQTGIIGLILFLIICLALIKLARLRKNLTLSSIIILLIAYSFSESVFETEYSFMIFLFFPIFFSLEKKSPGLEADY